MIMERARLMLTFILLLLVPLVLEVLPIETVTAKTITVPNDYPTIQGAINAAISGDTVYVKKGIYNETLVINMWGVSLIGEDRDLTIIDAQKVKTQVILVQGNNITIANFTLGNNDWNPPRNSGWYQQNGEGDGILIAPTAEITKFITIINNKIIGCPLSGIDVGFSMYNFIVGNEIVNLNSTFLGFPIGTAISVSGVENIIANNTFVNEPAGVVFTTRYLIGLGGNWTLSESNIVYGNQNITLAAVPSPFPIPSSSPSPSPSPIPSPSPSPQISILSPANTTYAAIYDPHITIPLILETNASLSWVGYSLDGGGNVTATNGTLIEIDAGSRSLTLYANDTSGNWAAPRTVYYSIAWNGGTPSSEPFPWSLGAASVAVAAVVAVGVLVYWKKRKHQSIPSSTIP